MGKIKTLFIIIFVLQAVSSCNPAEAVIYYIPEGFEGTLVIFFNQKTEEGKSFESSGKRVYQFPNEGVIMSKLDASYGIVEEEYWYVDKQNEPVQKIRVIYTHTQIDAYSDEVVAYNPQVIAAQIELDEKGNITKSTQPGISVLICPMNRIKTLSDQRDDAVRKASKEIN